jgi:hypothetical protein
MRTSARLGLYGGGLALLFAAAFGTAAALVPESAVEAWNEETEDMDMDAHAETETGHGDEHGGTATAVRGLAIEQDGYRLGEVAAPEAVGTEGELAFTITGADGEPLTEYAVSHEKQLHLIVVRADGTQFRHVHPTLDANGTWSLPWTWDAAGTYRVYADFVPADAEAEPDVTLTRTVEVAGDYGPAIPKATTLTAEVDGYTVDLEGDISAGTTSELTVAVTKDGEPVTTLEPYLGAFGHLVALREGDLAYLHVHPEGDEPAPGDLSGPEIAFATAFPTSGRYFLYLDFQVDGVVRTAAFTVETTGAGPDGGTTSEPDEHAASTPDEYSTTEPAGDGHGSASESDDHGH